MCIKDFFMNDGGKSFVKGKTYIFKVDEDRDGDMVCNNDEKNDHVNHYMSSYLLKEYFKLAERRLPKCCNPSRYCKHQFLTKLGISRCNRL